MHHPDWNVSFEMDSDKYECKLPRGRMAILKVRGNNRMTCHAISLNIGIHHMGTIYRPVSSSCSLSIYVC